MLVFTLSINECLPAYPREKNVSILGKESSNLFIERVLTYARFSLDRCAEDILEQATCHYQVEDHGIDGFTGKS